MRQRDGFGGGESGEFLISLYRESRLPREVNRTAKNN